MLSAGNTPFLFISARDGEVEIKIDNKFVYISIHLRT